jgi:hypothetical protein
MAYNNSMQNKQEIAFYLDFFVESIDLLDLGQAELVAELFKNNKILLERD